jgi:aldose 1-epimerase
VDTGLLRLASVHESGTSQVLINPRAGASIVEYSSAAGRDRIDWFQPADHNNGGAFAMVPFCSRVADGKFSFAGQAVKLPPNLPGEPHAIHGHGFQQEWRVDNAGSNSADLSFTHNAGAWPWSYRCNQRLHLEAEKLSITLQLHNLSDTPMPYGLGLHPYFPKHHGMVLTAQVASHLRLDDQLLPAEEEALPLNLRLPEGLDLKEQSLDNVFCRWQHTVKISWPDLGQRLLLEASAGCNHLVVWSPRGSNFCCIEPVSNLPDGFNLSADFPDAFAALPAGAHISMTFSFTPGYD